ncbi:4-hydroxy-tetrahydrodipicolinate synthase [Bordetella bronchiseptica]|uniref:4-hydroxy-tetrahydrodipicolinate synthase n=3 Tax=Bordetella bronchiseptica TaxID=518 RepID=UPI00045B9D5B|nr:4-hydroxy-tetrahydrodipicolinate synthase [Bordetella bronchiseptica]KAK50839.1 putative 4-hydroxy-tetrahydrodipicolinate synthase [Bordetella bronchiseptica OSU054]KCV24591.1 putative 4-hydroxy-tetrahydrodipicolinate synthase [Bordetella bronchiseptica 00-P-2730]KDB77035.1 putative 4-hydroxy-tetrahydrodipicolinate synthase [Bordetella bronchiseptica CA90 BB1334]KDC23079.1 putative 4-hydroxy-tetrahydrodipicolinate synthase [Bordetella bronchiseptica F2]KDD45765.1 putative 4-hydroxy-tetrahyd
MQFIDRWKMLISARTLRGIITATPTPFTREGGVDREVLRSHIEFLIGRGAAGLAPLGGTGEYPALSARERADVVRWTVEAARGRVPVVAGVLATGYEDAVQAGLAAREAGADALMVVTPYYALAGDAGVRAYFERYRAAVDLPIVLYEIPRRTNVELRAETIAAMAGDGTIVGIKYSGSDFAKLTRLIHLAGDTLAVLSGEEPLFPAAVALGAVGGVLAMSNLDPAPWARIQSLVEAGEMAQALQLHHRQGALADAVYSEMNPVGLKAALQLKGFAFGEARLPLQPAGPQTLLRLQQAFEALES